MSEKRPRAAFFRQPRYYSGFSCIGGNCPMSCCLIWRVDWTKDEVEKLKNAQCSEHLRELIDSSFIPFNGSDEKMCIKMEKNRCPFLDGDNLCSIQRELGAEYLSYTCTIYPRNAFLSGDIILNYCNLSCFRVMDTLCSDKDCTVLENYRPSAKTSGKAEVYSEADFLNTPALKYRHQIFEFLYEVLSDETYSIETAVTLGALSAQSLSKLIDKGAYEKIPESLNSLKRQLKAPEQIKKIENIKPNYAVQLGFLNEVNSVIIKSNLIDMLKENEAVSIDKYRSGMEKFRTCFADRPFAFRNIALNLLLECRMPFRDLKFSVFENYCYYAAAFASIKLVAASVFASGVEPENGFKVSSAYVSRSFAHNNVNVAKILDIYKKFNCMSPAYIALIVN